jgi:SAM-dependent methyltransferase
MDISSDNDAAFADWLTTPLGQYVWQREQRFFDEALADVFGYYAVQLALPDYDALRGNRMPCRITVGISGGCQVRCDPAQLPFASASIDLLVLPHTLDFHADPHEVLREAERVLVPEGRLVITGFNPWSLWGLARHYRRQRGMPWSGRFLGQTRVRDWLALLGFEARRHQFACYAPPIARAGWQQRFQFVEAAGKRWWQVGGAVYCLEAIKRVKGMRLMMPAWKRVNRVRATAALPVPDRRDQSPQADRQTR